MLVMIERVVDDFEQCVGLERFIDKSVCTFPHGFVRILFRSVPAYHDDGRTRGNFFRMFEHVIAVVISHPDIRKNEIERLR